MKSNKKLRVVRSYVCRDSRMTPAQKNALQTDWPAIGLKVEGCIDYKKIFKRDAPVVLEIGFGSGQSLLAIAKEKTTHDFIGIEMHQPGIANLIQGMRAEDVSNIRIFYHDAVEVLKQCIPDQSLAGIQIFFPDPWPKRRHHKRRLIQAEFINLIATKLQLGGLLHLATDWEDYAKHMMKIISASDKWVNLFGAQQFAERSFQRPIVTKFEKRGQVSGRTIWDLQFNRS